MGGFHLHELPSVPRSEFCFGPTQPNPHIHHDAYSHAYPDVRISGHAVDHGP